MTSVNVSGLLRNCTGENCTSPPVDVVEYEEYDAHDRARYILSQPSFTIAIVLGFVGILANTVSLVAIMKIRKSLTSYLRVVISLLMSDLLVAFSWLAHSISTVFLPVLRPGYGPAQPRLVSRCAYMSIKAFNTMGLNVILLNLMAMAINHYVAIIQPFQLHILLNRTRTNAMILLLWAIGAIAGFSDFISPIGEMGEYFRWNEKFNYCEFIWLTKYQEEFITFAIAAICLIAMLYIYLRIFFEVRYKSSQSIMTKGSNTNKKAIITTFFILASFIVCWLPLCMFNVVLIIMTRHGVSSALAPLVPYLNDIEAYLFDLVLLNTLCDPLIYGIRLKEVRRGYSLLFRCCMKPLQLSSSRSRSSNFSLVEYNQRKHSSSSGSGGGAMARRAAGESLLSPTAEKQEARKLSTLFESEQLIQHNSAV